MLADSMGEFFRTQHRRELVQKTIRNEEESFNKTLDRGIELFLEEADSLGNAKELSGEFASCTTPTASARPNELMAREAGQREYRWLRDAHGAAARTCRTEERGY